ncbi:MAG: hypothetical protein R6V46_16020 [Desulfatiglandaceae bacterium]
MRLRFDPYQVFQGSKTPAGLYARKKWLKEDQSSYQHDFEETVRFLLLGQCSDGSWDRSFIQTIGRLFWFHLTVREAIEPVREGLDWLLDQASIFFNRKRMHLKEKIAKNDLAGLPFTKSSSVVLITSAILFLSCVFGRGADPKVLKFYAWLEAQGSEGSGRWCGWSAYNNILRAFVVHPHYAESRAVTLAVRNLRHAQRASGIWPGDIPFYQTVNALAHLDAAEGDAQLASAFERLYKTQRRDGTWSRSQPEWHSFLAVHALKNKGEL